MSFSQFLVQKEKNLLRLSKAMEEGNTAIPDPSHAIAAFLKDWWRGEKYARVQSRKKNKQYEYENFIKMMSELQNMQADLSLLDAEIFAKPINDILNAATDQIKYFWGFIDNDANYNDEMLLLIETIKLMQNTFHSKPSDIAAFQFNFAHLMMRQSEIDTAETNEKTTSARSFARKAKVVFIIAMAIQLAAIMAMIAATILTLGSPVVAVIFSLSLVTSLLLLGPSYFLNEKSLRLQTEINPAHNLRCTLFAARSTAEACKVDLEQRRLKA